MKRIFLFLFALLTCMFASAQDTITFRNGRVEAAKVMEVGLGKVKYKKFSNQDGPLYLLDDDEVASIKYQNGDVETFEEPEVEASVEVVEETPVPVRERRVMFQAGPVVWEKTFPVKGASYPLKYNRNSPSYIMFDGAYMSEQEAYERLGFNYDVFLDCVRQYRTGRVMWIVGAGCVLFSMPTALFATIDDSDGARHLSLATLCAGAVLVPTGIVRFSTGKIGWKSVLRDYNREYNAKSENSAELKFGLTGNGVGMSLSF